jgi:hypothetical protein
MILAATGIWLVFSILSGIVARQIAVKWAEARGHTALTMPMNYYLWFITIHGVVNVLAWVGLYYWLVA